MGRTTSSEGELSRRGGKGRSKMIRADSQFFVLFHVSVCLLSSPLFSWRKKELIYYPFSWLSVFSFLYFSLLEPVFCSRDF